MTKSKQRKVRVYTYEVKTPYVNIDTSTTYDNYYNHAFFMKFLKAIIRSNNKKKDGTNYFHLHSIEQSEDADVFVGKIHTTKYGTSSEILNINTDKVVNKLAPEHGLKNEINFALNKNNGKLLIQNDPFRVANRNFISEFLEERQQLVINEVYSFNKQNNPNQVFKERIFLLTTVYDKGFYDQLAEIINVKSVSITTTVEKSEVNDFLNNFTKEGSDESDYIHDISEMTYTFKNKIRNQGVSSVKAFVKNALDLEKISSITAQGGNKKAELKVKPKSHEIITSINSEGVLDQSKIITEMINLIKK